METKITRNEKEELIKLKNPKGREVKKAMKLLFAAQKLEEQSERFPKMEEYIDYIEEMSANNVNMTIDELDDLDTDEKNKIVEFYSNKVNSRFDFLTSSLKQEN